MDFIWLRMGPVPSYCEQDNLPSSLEVYVSDGSVAEDLSLQSSGSVKYG